MKKNLTSVVSAGAVLLALGTAAQAATLAYWNFNTPDNAGTIPAFDSPLSADTGSGSLSWTFTSGTTGIADFSGTTENAQGADPAGTSLSIQGGDTTANNGESLEIAVSTAGEQDILVSFAQRGTGTGFATHTIEYSTDGTTFVSYGATPYTVNQTSTWVVQQIDFTSITAVDNNANFKVRITLDGATGDTGNNRIDNLLVESGATAPTPTPTPGPLTYDFDIAVAEADILAGTSGTAVEMDGVAVSADGNTIYVFDSDSGTDGIVKYDVIAGTASIYATEAQIAGAAGGSSASGSDLTIDSNGILYGIFRSPSDSSFIARIPSQGTVELMADSSLVDDATAIAVSESNNRLYISFTDFFVDAIEQQVAYIPLDGTSVSSITQLASEAALTSALGDTDIGMGDIAVLQNGNVLMHNAFGDDVNADGDIVQITPSGTISAFADNDDYVGAVGTTGTVNTSAMTVLSDGSVILISIAGSGAGEFIVRGSPDGTSWELIATETDLLGDSDIPVGYDIDVTGNGLAAGPDGSFFWAGQIVDAVIVAQPLQADTSSSSWSKYE